MPNRKSKKKTLNRGMEHRLPWSETINTRHTGAVTSMDRLDPRAQSLVSFLFG